MNPCEDYASEQKVKTMADKKTKPSKKINGFVDGLSLGQYHAHPAISNSELSLFARDPNLLCWKNACPVDDEKLKTFDFGKAVHAICLEPDLLKSDFVMMPEINGRTNAGKEEKAEFIEANKDKSILTFDEHKKLNLIYESIMAHPAARKIIESDGTVEGSFFFKDPDTGVDCRVRPDKIIDGYVADIKTTPDLGKFKFSVDDYRYYVQDPFYRDGLFHCGIETEHMKFLAIQKTIEIGRYPCMVVTLPDEVVEYGREIYKRDLENYAKFIESPKIIDSHELELGYGFLGRVEAYQVEGII